MTTSFKTSDIKDSPSGIPADYSNPADPHDVAGMQQLVDDLHSGFWEEAPEVQRQAIANAFRAAFVSPSQNLKWNSIVYQDLQSVPWSESDPDVFERVIREKKAAWDTFGQQTMDIVGQNSKDKDLIHHVQNGGIEKYMPGIWNNVRNCASIGPYVEEIRQAALEDIARGGDGKYYRQAITNLNIPGVGPKIAAFTWLLLAPKTSKLATIDRHMMRHFGEKEDAPKDLSAYMNMERKLDQERKDSGYNDVPLGAYQWAVWDHTRTPGYHQDHTPLKPLDPTDWRDVDWAPRKVMRKAPPPEVNPDQQTLLSKWKIIG